MDVRLGSFRLLEPLARGGMGAVWAGRHEAQGLEVAVKVLQLDALKNRDLMTAFEHEIRLVARLNHPHIVAVLDHGVVSAQAAQASGGQLVQGTPYLVMERARRALSRGDPPMPWEVLRELLLDLLAGLAHAHARGVLHRDLKPGNLLIGGVRAGVRIADFGLASVLSRAPELHASSLGTPPYMAPEQFERRWRDYGPWTDLYSLGCVVHVLCGGRPPFEGARVVDVMVSHLRDLPPPLSPRMAVPDALQDWVSCLLQKEPRRRFRCAGDAALALRNLGHDVVIGQVPERWRAPTPISLPALRGAGIELFSLRDHDVVGRATERDQLWALLRETRRLQRARAVVLRGPAGFGKSRLARWLCERASELGAAVPLRVPHVIAARSGGIGPALATALGVEGMSRLDALHRLRCQVPATAEALLELVSESLTTPDAQELAGPRERYDAVRGWLLAQDRLPIVWLDDAQWGFDSLGMVEALLGTDTPVLFVIVVRDEALATRPAEAALLARISAGAVCLDIGPLAEEDRLAMVAGMLGLERGLARRVALRCGGNPLFAEQLLGDWIERGLLLAGPRGFVLSQDDGLPEGLHQVWGARIERLLSSGVPADGPALELAAVLGMDVVLSTWRAACRSCGLHPSRGLLDRLLAWRLVRSSGPARWSFVQVMVREFLLARARRGGRLVAHHLACVEVLEGRVDPVAAGRRGLHLVAAGRPRAALNPLLQGAASCLERGELARLGTLLDARDTALVEAGLTDDDPAWGVGWLLRARSAHQQGDVPEAVALTERAEREARAHWWPGVLADALVLRARCQLGVVPTHVIEGWLAEAQRLGEREPERVGDCLLVSAQHAQLHGHLLDARGLAEQASRSSANAGSARGVAEAQWILGSLAFQRGEIEVARWNYRQASSLFEGRGARSGVARCQVGLADVARADEDLVVAMEGYLRAQSVFESLGSPLAVHALVSLAVVHLEREDYDAARACLLEAWGPVDVRHRSFELDAVRVFLSVCAAAAQDWSVFDSLLSRAQAGLTSTGFVDVDLGRAAEQAAEVARDAGQPARARAALCLAVSQWHGLERLDLAENALAALDSLGG